MPAEARENAALVDGQPADSVPLDDRGLLYGDGLFETMNFSAGQCLLWRWHIERLQRGGQQLGIAIPPEAILRKDCSALAANDKCVIRMTVTRGSSERPGYAVTGTESARRILVRLPRPPARPPLRVAICRGHLPTPGPASGLKHLSRLDQVMLARETQQDGCDEGLVFDQRDQLCEGLQSNVVLKIAGQAGWLTPPVGAGVAGACRAALLEHQLVYEHPVGRSDLDRCVAMALCNAVRGVEPVLQLAGWGALDPAPALELAADFARLLRQHDAGAQRACPVR